MNRTAIRLAPTVATVALTAAFAAAPSLAAEPGEVSVPKDLTAVIALQGQPCGQVVSAKQQGDNDYIVSCQDGHRYRVYVNADGRVVVEKR